jgi:DNA-binding IclR family transcriptional regulator
MLTSTRIDNALRHLKGMFLEEPDKSLSLEEVHRHSEIDKITCKALLLALEASRFLARSGPDQFKVRSGALAAERLALHQ